MFYQFTVCSSQASLGPHTIKLILETQDNKIRNIAVVKEITGLSLFEAKELVFFIMENFHVEEGEIITNEKPRRVVFDGTF